MRRAAVLMLLVALSVSLGCGGRIRPAETPKDPASPPSEKGSKPEMPPIPTPRP